MNSPLASGKFQGRTGSSPGGKFRERIARALEVNIPAKWSAAEVTEIQSPKNLSELSAFQNLPLIVDSESVARTASTVTDVCPLLNSIKSSPQATLPGPDSADQLDSCQVPAPRGQLAADSPSLSVPQLPPAVKCAPWRSFGGMEGAGFRDTFNNRRLSPSSPSLTPSSPNLNSAGRGRRVTFSEQDTEAHLAKFRTSSQAGSASSSRRQSPKETTRRRLVGPDSGNPPSALRRTPVQRVAGGAARDADPLPPLADGQGAGHRRRRLTSSEAESSKALAAFRRGLQTVETAIEALAEPLMPLAGDHRRQTLSEADTAQQLAAFRGRAGQQPVPAPESPMLRRLTYTESESAGQLAEFRNQLPGEHPLDSPTVRSRRTTRIEGDGLADSAAFRAGLVHVVLPGADCSSRPSSQCSGSSTATTPVARRLTASEPEVARELVAFRMRALGDDLPKSPASCGRSSSSDKGKFRRVTPVEDPTTLEAVPLLISADSADIRHSSGCEHESIEVDIRTEGAVDHIKWHGRALSRTVGLVVVMVTAVAVISVLSAVLGRGGLLPLPHHPSIGSADILGKCNTCLPAHDCPLNAACTYAFDDGALLDRCGHPVLCVGGYVFNTSTCECDPVATWPYRQPCPGGFTWSSARGFCARDPDRPCVSRYLCVEGYGWNHLLCECLPAAPSSRCTRRYMCVKGYTWNQQVCSCVP